jgi:hypothetical protein
LQDRLRARGQKVLGRKAELIQRLLGNEETPDKPKMKKKKGWRNSKVKLIIVNDLVFGCSTY